MIASVPCFRSVRRSQRALAIPYCSSRPGFTNEEEEILDETVLEAVPRLGRVRPHFGTAFYVSEKITVLAAHGASASFAPSSFVSQR